MNQMLLALTDCVEWLGTRKESGYGVVSSGGRKYRAHRVVWTVCRGPIPPGMCVCHRCDNPNCINIDHLFLGTRKDNYDDMVAKGRQPESFVSAARPFCGKGHPMSGENLYVKPSGTRICRMCRNAWKRGNRDYQDRINAAKRAKTVRMKALKDW